MKPSRAHDLKILKEIAEGLNGAANADDALRDSLSRAIRLLGLRTGWVWLIDPRTGRFYNATAQALPPFLREPVRMTGTTCWCIEAFRTGKLAAENIDVIECSRLRAAIKARDADTKGLRYHASIPLQFGGRPLGIMNVATSRWRRLTRRELDLLSTIASQVGIAIERARLAEDSVRLARTEERTRLARDLHDTLSQGLTAIGLHIEAAMGATREDATRAQLERALSATRASLGEARRSLRDLRSAPMKGQPLADALAALGREMTAETGVRVHVRSEVSELPAPMEEEHNPIGAEALANIRRHAHAREVDVTLTQTPRQVRLVVADDGAGFEPRKRADGFGVLGMRERAAGLGGRVRIQSRSGRGTRVAVAVPRRGGRA